MALTQTHFYSSQSPTGGSYATYVCWSCRAFTSSLSWSLHSPSPSEPGTDPAFDDLSFSPSFHIVVSRYYTSAQVITTIDSWRIESGLMGLGPIPTPLNPYRNSLLPTSHTPLGFEGDSK